MPDLAESMLFAWRQRGQRAIAELEAAATAPALFKPEFAERASADLNRAQVEMNRWSS